jgi:tight adherence protein C
MSPVLAGALLGAAAGVGVLAVVQSLVVARRPRLDVRVLPYLRDLPGVGTPDDPSYGLPRGVAGTFLPRVAAVLDRLLGGTASVSRRLGRAGLSSSVHDYRVEQAVWGLLGLCGMTVLALVVVVRSPERTVPMLILCGVAFVLGALLRDNRLSAQVRERERRMLEEFPTVAELMALAVAAGEGPVAALDRVVTRADGELSRELAGVLARIRTGTAVTRALDDLAAGSGLPAVARFAEAVAVALERGTPLAEVMHAQAADVREAGRRALIETGARREVIMMVPVVFLVLPVTVLFAFWPGLVGLRVVTP